MRLVRPFQADALSAPRHPRLPLRRQHGARHVQHRARRKAARRRTAETFYYSDYNYNAQALYNGARWPCCSGTLPQVAADYRINMYFRAPQAVYVNLYVPSTLRWTENGAALSLTQEGEYPYEDHVTFTVTTSTLPS